MTRNILEMKTAIKSFTYKICYIFWNFPRINEVLFPFCRLGSFPFSTKRKKRKGNGF